MSDDIFVSQPDGHCLAELNIGLAFDDLDTPTMADFMKALDKVNRIADRSSGFVWRLQDEAGNATGVKYSENPREIVNLSVWQTSANLEHYDWNRVHRQFMKRRADWFVPLDQPYFVLWWVPVGVLHTLAEALDRLAWLRSDGHRLMPFAGPICSVNGFGISHSQWHQTD